MKFIKNYGMISRLLTDLLKKDTFLWSETATEAFRALKDAMTHASALPMPNFTLPFVLETDASSNGIGSILMLKGRL